MSADINSKEYWDDRFGSGDWEDKQGREQSEFFYRLAVDNMPKWFIDDCTNNGLSICDHGCAEGEGVALLSESFSRSSVTGIDISEEALKRARKYYPKHEFICGDINNLQRDFDVIFSSNTLEHFTDPQTTIKNLLPHAKKYFVTLLPFKEYDRIDEHFATFDYNSFPLDNDNFRLVYYKEIDCRKLKGTQWNGFEILLIYANMTENAPVNSVLSRRKNGQWSVSHMENGNFTEIAKLNDEISSKQNKLTEMERKFNERLEEKQHEVEAANEQIEADLGAIMQIQFEAAQYKQAALDARETYIWRTGARIEKLFNRLGITFIRTLLIASGFKRSGLLLTLKKASNELFNRKNLKLSGKLYKQMCREKFLRYKLSHDEISKVDLTSLECPCEKGLVSIVLPVLNGENVIRQAIDSILAQTYKNFELIIIDDGSTDSTPSIVDKYASADSRITVVHQENKKLPRALSRGFSMAKGEFYTWTSADNIMLPECIERLAEELSIDEECGMVYGNIRTINKHGKVIRGHFWFEKPYFSGNVNLPNDSYALNTFANNTIGAAFLYRAKAAHILEDYSKYKHTLEDYDYWMRLNSLFPVKHINYAPPIYLYRFHEDSLTAHDKELGITKNRYKLMILDDYRRDFYTSALIWVVETDDDKNPDYVDFVKSAHAAGHVILSRDKVLALSLPPVAPGVCYVYFGENPNIEAAEQMSAFAMTALVTNGGSSAAFDVLITASQRETLEKLDSYRGWFHINGGRNIFSFLDAKFKNRILYGLEGRIEGDKESDKKISVIICTYMRGEKLTDAIWSIIRQSFGKKDYEIIIADNAPFAESGLEQQIKAFADKYKEIDGFIRYIAVPQKGLSYARNAGVWNAKAKYLLFLDDDVLADYYLLEEIYSAFKYHDDAGVIGGQIILDIPFPRPEVVRPGWENLWSQFKTIETNYKEATQQFEFPYGANYAASRDALWRVGGFRMCYGRVGNDYAGGEETALAFKMRQIGYSVGVQPRAKVLHRVDHDRFNMEHVNKTIRAGILTTHKFYKDLYSNMGWTLRYVKNQIKITRQEIKRFRRKKVNRMDIYYKQCALNAWNEMKVIIENEKELIKKL